MKSEDVIKLLIFGFLVVATIATLILLYLGISAFVEVVIGG